MRGSKAGGARSGAARGWRHPAWGSSLLALFLYLPALGHGFVRDDHTLIERNPFLRGDGFLARLLTSDFWASGGGASGLWRPVVTASFWAEGRLFGWTPAPFHAVNVTAHALATAALAALMLRCGAPLAAAWAAALWFAVMPVHVESVAWIAGRTDLFAALFFLLALWLDRRARAAGRAWPGVPALVALGFALGSKESAAAFVAVAAALEWTGAGTRAAADGAGVAARARAVARWVWPYAAVTAAYLAAHAAAADPPAAVAWLDAAARGARRAGGWAMFGGHLAFLWPWFPHAPDRMFALPAPASSIAAGALLLAAAVAATLVATWRRWRVATPLAILWLAVLPASVAAWTGGMFAHAERLFYLGSAGAAWLVGEALAGGLGKLARSGSGRVASTGGAHRAPGGRAARLVAGALALVLIGGSALEAARAIPAWRSDATMYEAKARLQPDDPLGHVGRAETLAAEGRLDDADAALARAEALAPGRPEVRVSRASLEFRRARWERALGAARGALALDSLRTEARLIEAASLLRLRRLDEAGRAIAAWRAHAPDSPEAASLAGQWLVLQGRDAEAIPLLEAATRWDAGDPVLWMSLGTAYQRSGRAAPAATAYARGLALAPGHYEGWLQLAAARHALGDAAGREAALARAASLPGAADGRVAALRARFAAPAP